MRRLNNVRSRAKFVVAAAILSAAMLSFVGDASGGPKDTGKVVKMCTRQASCRLVKMCLVDYCYTETVCGPCVNCYIYRVRRGRGTGRNSVCTVRVIPA